MIICMAVTFVADTEVTAAAAAAAAVAACRDADSIKLLLNRLKLNFLASLALSLYPL